MQTEKTLVMILLVLAVAKADQFSTNLCCSDCRENIKDEFVTGSEAYYLRLMSLFSMKGNWPLNIFMSQLQNLPSNATIYSSARVHDLWERTEKETLAWKIKAN